MFDRYNSEGPLYVWRDKSGDKYQFHFKSVQFMDSRDNDIPHEQLMYFRTEHPVLSKLFRKGEEVIATEPDLSYWYARLIIKGRWPKGETIVATSPSYAYKYAVEIVGGRWPEGEVIINFNPTTSQRYADFLKSRGEVVD